MRTQKTMTFRDNGDAMIAGSAHEGDPRKALIEDERSGEPQHFDFTACARRKHAPHGADGRAE